MSFAITAFDGSLSTEDRPTSLFDTNGEEKGLASLFRSHKRHSGLLSRDVFYHLVFSLRQLKPRC